MAEKKSVGSRILIRMLGFFIFLVLLGIAKVLSFYILSDFYTAIVGFFLDNLFLAFLIFFITLIADTFWAFWFPFNIPAPVVSAVSSIFIVTYIYRLWLFLDNYLLTGIEMPISLVYQLVFWSVLVGGYVVIILRFVGWGDIRAKLKERREEKEEAREEREKKNERRKKRKNKK